MANRLSKQFPAHSVISLMRKYRVCPHAFLKYHADRERYWFTRLPNGDANPINDHVQDDGSLLFIGIRRLWAKL